MAPASAGLASPGPALNVKLAGAQQFVLTSLSGDPDPGQSWRATAESISFLLEAYDGRGQGGWAGE